ncbi:MAG: NADPH-dependent glutamate synthase [Candidatus Cloacimonetes bacterium]|nr:NADPH-dependent glutamate synthase [Candidatus Cloacimonadota bacterium]
MIQIGGTRIPMQEQKVQERIKNFYSVPLGYTEKEVVAEAQRCILCKDAPCEKFCPVNMKIRDMIRKVAERDFKQAFLIAKEDNAIPAIAGRVCPQENQCEGVCPLGIGFTGNGINIGKLEAFIADWAMENGIKEKFYVKERAEKVALIGSGPASISCAVDLRKFGYKVTIYEALHKAGGVLQYGIPAFRLPKDIVEYELSYLTEIGVEIKLNNVVGQNIKFQKLNQEYDAIFIGTGAGAPLFMGIEGEKLKGLYSANEFLIRTNLMKAYKFPEYDTPIVCGNKVGVIGAGNVTMDSARCAKRLGAKNVQILYRRTKKEAPARDEEIQHALEEGIILKELVNPTRILGNDMGWVNGIELIKMKLGKPDKSGRPRPIPIQGSEFIMEVDTVVEAIGTKPNRLFLTKTPELETTDWGTIKVDKNLMTNIKGVTAGGDAMRGNATVILALGDGRKAAKTVHKYILMKNST